MDRLQRYHHLWGLFLFFSMMTWVHFRLNLLYLGDWDRVWGPRSNLGYQRTWGRQRFLHLGVSAVVYAISWKNAARILARAFLFGVFIPQDLLELVDCPLFDEIHLVVSVITLLTRHILAPKNIILTTHFQAIFKICLSFWEMGFVRLLLLLLEYLGEFASILVVRDPNWPIWL